MENQPKASFNHNSDSLSGSLNIEEYRAHVLKVAISFDFLSNKSFTEDMYDNVDEAPEYMRKKTYLLENTLERCKNINEQIFVCLIYDAIYSKTIEGLRIEENILKERADIKAGKSKKKSKSFQEMMFEKQMDPKAKDSYTNLLKIIKDVAHDFDKFCNKVIPYEEFKNGRPEPKKEDKGPTDIGDVLRKILGGIIGNPGIQDAGEIKDKDGNITGGFIKLDKGSNLDDLPDELKKFLGGMNDENDEEEEDDIK